MSSRVGRAVVSLVLVGGAFAVGQAGGAAVAAPSDWMDPVTLAPVGAEDVHAVVADSGDMAVVWEHAGAIEAAVRPSDGDWAAPVTVAAAHGDFPLAAFDATGRLLVVWTKAVAGDPVRLMSRAMDDTGVWASAVVVAHRADGAIRADDLAVDTSGDAVVGWLWGNRALVSSGSIGGGWSAPVAWSKTLSVDVALGDGGHAAAMLQRWVGPRSEEITLTFEVARRSPAGVWGRPGCCRPSSSRRRGSAPVASPWTPRVSRRSPGSGWAPTGPRWWPFAPGRAARTAPPRCSPTSRPRPSGASVSSRHRAATCSSPGCTTSWRT
ncbi:MAG: hypothetical protein U0R80_15930 [Nocardioidaceae bacterium]